jgi:hypothetical protein
MDDYWKDYFKRTQIDFSESLDIQSVQQEQKHKQDARVWKKIKHLHLNPLHDLPNFDRKSY